MNYWEIEFSYIPTWGNLYRNLRDENEGIWPYFASGLWVDLIDRESAMSCLWESYWVLPIMSQKGLNTIYLPRSLNIPPTTLEARVGFKPSSGFIRASWDFRHIERTKQKSWFWEKNFRVADFWANFSHNFFYHIQWSFFRKWFCTVAVNT